jgi:hypothetical protein
MGNRPAARLFSVVLLWVSCVCAAFAGCGGSDDGGTAFNGSGGGSGAKDGGGTGGIDIDGNIDNQPLTIDPPTATLTITDKTVVQSQQFTAKLGGAAVSPAWSLDNYNFVIIDANGLASTTGFAAGKVTVNAVYNGKSATAELTVNVVIQEDVDPGIDPTNHTALEGAASADPGPDVSKLLYPYDKTVMPKGVVSPLLMWNPGTVAPQAAKVKLSTAQFSWEGYYQVAAPATPRLAVPQDVWGAALESAAGGSLAVSITKAATGVAYGPFGIDLTIAAGSLKGVVYYMTYENPTGIWSVRPGNADAPVHVKSGCVVCHSVSANGQFISTGAEVNVQSAESGVYQVDLNGNATQIAQSPSTLGGDSRGLAFAAWVPSGKYVMRSQSNFWGGVNQMAWRVDATGQKLDEATVVGLGADVSAYLPTFSPDGKRFAFTQGAGESAPPGAVSRSVDVMDVSIDDNTGAFGTLTFTNRQVALDNGASGKVTKYTTFLPNSDLLVLQETAAYEPSYDSMLATYVNGVYGAADGKLSLVDLGNGKAHIDLANANSGIVPADAEKNFEPFSLPITAGGYFWVVFTSIRQYGNLHEGGNIRKQLWVFAVTPGAPAGADPSHPPFYLPNQTDTKNERGFWALDPCKPKGSSCETGDECCEGFCRPSDPNDPSSPKVCGEQQGCSQIQEKCTSDLDCCAAQSGIKCVAGLCSPKPPS